MSVSHTTTFRKPISSTHILLSKICYWLDACRYSKNIQTQDNSNNVIAFYISFFVWRLQRRRFEIQQNSMKKSPNLTLVLEIKNHSFNVIDLHECLSGNNKQAKYMSQICKTKTCMSASQATTTKPNT